MGKRQPKVTNSADRHHYYLTLSIAHFLAIGSKRALAGKEHPSENAAAQVATLQDPHHSASTALPSDQRPCVQETRPHRPYMRPYRRAFPHWRPWPCGICIMRIYLSFIIQLPRQLRRFNASSGRLYDAFQSSLNQLFQTASSLLLLGIIAIVKKMVPQSFSNVVVLLCIALHLVASSPAATLQSASSPVPLLLNPTPSPS